MLPYSNHSWRLVTCLYSFKLYLTSLSRSKINKHTLQGTIDIYPLYIINGLSLVFEPGTFLTYTSFQRQLKERCQYMNIIHESHLRQRIAQEQSRRPLALSNARKQAWLSFWLGDPASLGSPLCLGDSFSCPHIWFESSVGSGPLLLLVLLRTWLCQAHSALCLFPSRRELSVQHHLTCSQISTHEKTQTIQNYNWQRSQVLIWALLSIITPRVDAVPIVRG